MLPYAYVWRGYIVNIAIFVAGCLMTLTVFVHVLMGGVKIMKPLRATRLPRLVAAVMEIVWHGVNVTLICLAGGLFWLAWHDNQPLMWLICAIQVGFATLFIWYGFTRLKSLWPMPQWIVFLGIPVLTVWGMG